MSLQKIVAKVSSMWRKTSAEEIRVRWEIGRILSDGKEQYGEDLLYEASKAMDQSLATVRLFVRVYDTWPKSIDPIIDLKDPYGGTLSWGHVAVLTRLESADIMPMAKKSLKMGWTIDELRVEVGLAHPRLSRPPHIWQPLARALTKKLALVDPKQLTESDLKDLKGVRDQINKIVSSEVVAG